MATLAYFKAKFFAAKYFEADFFREAPAAVIVLRPPGGGDSLKKLKLDAERRRKRKEEEAREIERLEKKRAKRRERQKEIAAREAEEAGPPLLELERSPEEEMRIAAAEATALASALAAKTEIDRRETEARQVENMERARQRRDVRRQQLADLRLRRMIEIEEDAAAVLLLAA